MPSLQFYHPPTPHLQGGIGGAIMCYRRAINIDPNDAVTHYNLGIAMATLDNCSSAIASFGKAIELNPKYIDAHYNLGKNTPCQNPPP
jgi:tetratricopeptide (TPR) repeat protein